MNIDHQKLNFLAKILLVVGGVNWGLIGLFNLDIVALIFGHMSLLSRLIYIIVGAAAGYKIYRFMDKRKQEKLAKTV